MVTPATMTACALCGLPTAHPIWDEQGQAFCCPSCREVSALLGESGDGNQAAESPQPPNRATIQRSNHLTTQAPNNQQTTLTLSGMWCASCSWLVSETLKRAPGVLEAEVSFVQREARVTYDPERTTPKKFRRLVRGLGYRAFLPGETPHDEEEAHANRLLIGGVFAMHVMLLSIMLYVRQIFGFSSPETAWLEQIFEYMIALASLPVMLIFGLPILRAGVASLMRLQPNMHALIALGAFSAFGLSVRNLFAGQAVYFDTAAMLLFLVSLGHWFEIRAQKTGKQAVERLLDEIPTTAVHVSPQGEREVPVDQIRPGMRIRVRPGQRFPVDGLVAMGQGDVDESLLTGEPTPVFRGEGDRVLAGTISLDGGFEVIATAVGAQSVAGQIGKMLHQALWARSPVERLADRLAALMVPAAIVIAAGTFVFWNYRAGPETALLYALSVLLIACPCALGLATPLTLWLGLGKASQMGAIVRSTTALENLARVQQVCFDKTGTLTRLPMRVQALANNGVELRTFLSHVAAVERASEHPVAQAILQMAEEHDLSPPRVADFRLWPGQGVSASLEGETLWVGSRGLMEAQGCALSPEMQRTVAKWQRRGLRVVYAGRQGEVIGVMGLGESTRPGVRQAIRELQSLGLEVIVLTGDDAAAGRRWQQELGIRVYAEMRPEHKLAFLRESGAAVAMVGDGINDGPALAAADVGIALSRGTDVAQNAADVVLLGEDLRSIPGLIRLSRAAMRKVRQNLAWAFFYNLIGLGLAVSGLLQPVLAALAMVLSSLIVTGNALRIRKVPVEDRESGIG